MPEWRKGAILLSITGTLSHRNIGIGYRLASGFIAVIAFGLAGYFNATQALERYVAGNRTLADRNLQTISAAKDLANSAHASVAAATAYLLSGDDRYRLEAWQADAQADKAYALLAKTSDTLGKESPVQAPLDRIDHDRQALTGPGQARIIGLIADRKTAEAHRLFDSEYLPARASFDVDIAQITAAVQDLTTQQELTNHARMNLAILTGWLIQGTASLFIALLIVGTVSRSFQKFLGAQAALRSREERFRALSRNASDVTVIVDADGRIDFVDAAAERNWGFMPEGMTGLSLFDHVHPDDHGRIRDLLERACASPNNDLLSEARLLHISGAWCPSEVTANNLSAEPSINGIVLTCRDISERKSLEQELAHQAFHDALTGLPNRALFVDRLSHALTRARRSNGLVAACVLDLDNFKVINDSLGHPAGDQLIIQVTERLRAGIRAGDTVARLGGDEFAILLENVSSNDEAVALIERVTSELSQPITIEGHPMFVTISTGIAVGDAVEQDPGRLLRNADIAMYRAKTNGKARFAIFDDSMTGDALERLELEADLRDAIDHGQLRVYYQPIVDLVSGRVAEVEALVRWEHPTRGLIPPIKFIPIAEETGLIVPLGLWVLREACRQTKIWQDEFTRNPELMVGVNLSARQLEHPDLIEEVSAVLLETGLSPSSLRLEITESLTVQNGEWTQMRLRALKALGVKLAVDDFGTGYSSMAYLSNFPIDTLKIDRCFVNKIAEPEGTAIVQAIITLAHSLGLNVTGEGIESQDQLRSLQLLGCHEGQGYYFSRPVTGEAMASLLTRTQLIPVERRLAA
jgi:diguanylate cyclase (GGDEF)-like protein/PAS domain S-box-containing protein